jgi:hypothetical protein
MPDRFRNEHLGQWMAARMLALRQLRGVVDVRLAAIRAAQLGLVEPWGDALRFQHGVLQAYLGSLALQGVLAESEAGDEFFDDAFRGSYRPGRELLAALVLFSRRPAAKPVPGGAGDPAMTNATGQAADIVTMLWHKAVGRPDPKALDMLAAALEIDAVVAPEQRRQHELAAYAADRWATFRASDLRTLEEAKLGFVHRFGEALREADLRSREASPGLRLDFPRPLTDQEANLDAAYRSLFDIGRHESMSHLVRHAVALELGAGGVTAFRAPREHVQRRA